MAFSEFVQTEGIRLSGFFFERKHPFTVRKVSTLIPNMPWGACISARVRIRLCPFDNAHNRSLIVLERMCSFSSVLSIREAQLEPTLETAEELESRLGWRNLSMSLPLATEHTI